MPRYPPPEGGREVPPARLIPPWTPPPPLEPLREALKVHLHFNEKRQHLQLKSCEARQCKGGDVLGAEETTALAGTGSGGV